MEHKMHDMTEGRKMNEAAEEHKNHDMSSRSVPPHKTHRDRHEGHVTEDFFIQSIFRFKLEFPGSISVLFLLSTFVYFYGGYPFLKGFFNEIRDRSPGMMTLIATAISAAYFYSSAVVFGLMGEIFFWELATLIDIMLLGHWIEMRSVMGASRALEELARIMPSEAHLIRDGSIVDVRVEALRPGDRVLVKPGEKIPVDGAVVEGETSVNESMLTGESRPVAKETGSNVIGGSINGQGSVSVEVKRIGSESYLSQVLELVRQAQESKSKTQDLADRAALWLTIISLSVGAITLAAWLYLGRDLSFAMERAVTVMVISCPHALGLAVPLVVAVSTSLAAKGGLLIRDRSAFERARELQAVVFDKTGTLTEGRFGITDIVPLAELDDSEVLRIAASLEASSEHPIATGIASGLKEKGMKAAVIQEFKAIPGRGIEGLIDGKSWMVTSPGYLRESGIDLNDDRVNRLAEQGKTVVFLLQGRKPVGAIALADIIRVESRQAIETLKSMNIRCMMLTGDNRFVARWVAEDLGLDDFFAEVLQADVGIAIGAGTDVAVESADIVLVRNDPRDVANIVRLSRKTYAKMLQNLLWATGYNALAIPLAAGVLYSQGIMLSPAAGAILMSASTVIVAVNARMLKMQM
ncbi:MAG: copper-translocating P-type ATPase [Methanothrix sp.]|nr:copper-translocating P-type ATPase [Methanothrix sp.]OYV10435.1 MAG: Cu2+-exporting ATPase [Methanosaeta sp. NSP1]